MDTVTIQTMDPVFLGHVPRPKRPQSCVTIVVVNTSVSLDSVDYADKVNAVLQKMTPPLSLVEWAHDIKITHHMTHLPKFTSHVPTKDPCNPFLFVERLPQFNRPFHLHLFTDGDLTYQHFPACQRILEENRGMPIRSVCLHYFGAPIDPAFMRLFWRAPITVYLNEELLTPRVRIENASYDFIMDNQFEIAVLLLLNLTGADPRNVWKTVCDAAAGAWRARRDNDISIEPYHRRRDAEGCAQYLQTLPQRTELQRRFSRILDLFSPRIHSYPLSSFRRAGGKDEPPGLACECLQCDVLYETCETACIPIKRAPAERLFEDGVLRDPFSVLESDALSKRLADLAEPYVMDYERVYLQLGDRTSPFTRDPLAGVYLLNDGRRSWRDLIRHNDATLRCLFPDALPGKEVLWHVVFLYLLAQRRFPERKARFYEEIRLLGRRGECWMSLHPRFDPPLVENLETCFWYMARVQAFPNSQRRNLLRHHLGNPQFFAQFYREVYEPDYRFPYVPSLCQLYDTLRKDPKTILPVLAHYFESERLDLSGDPFRTVLYRERRKPGEEEAGRGDPGCLRLPAPAVAGGGPPGEAQRVAGLLFAP